jgi:hypothetical protein
MSRRWMVLAPGLPLLAAATAGRAETTAQVKAEPEVKRLLLLVDRDRNGKVSRDEFMAFMNAEFDRLDVNRDSELDVKELTELRVSSKHLISRPTLRLFRAAAHRAWAAAAQAA